LRLEDSETLRLADSIWDSETLKLYDLRLFETLSSRLDLRLRYIVLAPQYRYQHQYVLGLVLVSTVLVLVLVLVVIVLCRHFGSSTCYSEATKL
jgi:hypothetical protein